MEKTRSSYALFSFDENNQNHTDYVERKRQIENFLDKEKTKAKLADIGDTMISANINMDQKKQMYACLYKGYSFVAIKDRNNHSMSFEEPDNRLAETKENVLDTLELRLDNALNSFIRNGKLNIQNQECNKDWQELVPTIEKIIEYEKELDELPDTRRHMIQNSKEYDQKIDDIIISPEEKSLHPLEEQAWEDYLGMDVGSSGIRKHERNMTSLEEDIMEKAYHKDFGGEGFVDEKWHEEVHVEPVKTVSVKERMESAKKEAAQLGNSKEVSMEKTNQIEERELTLM